MQQDRLLAGLLGEAGVRRRRNEMTLDDGTIKVTFLDRKITDPTDRSRARSTCSTRIVTSDAASSVPHA